MGPVLKATLISSLLVAATIANAVAEYPERPVRIIVPSAPGGGPDTTARIIAAEMTRHMGKQFVIDNRPGASGLIGTELIARATPDGYTIGTGTFPTLVANRSLVAKLPYDPDRDIQPIIQHSRGYNVLAVTPSLPIFSVQELIDHARKERGKVLYASSGVGTSLHLSAELFKRMAGIEITHVPFKGQPQAITELIAGNVHMMFDNLSSISVHVQAGRVRGLAVTSTRRLAAFPELPTIAEAGVPNFEVTTFGGVVAPGGVRRAIIDRLNAEINKAMATSTVKEKFTAFGSEPAGGTPEEFAAFIKRESARWAAVIKAANIKAE